MTRIGKVLLVAAAAVLLGNMGKAQTPPADQGQLPQLPKPRQLLLEVDLKLNAGAASTKERSISLNFTAREKSDLGNVTIRDATANVTHYRVLEADNPSTTSLSGQPWIPITSLPPVFELPLRDKDLRRYGERHVLMQVKTTTLESTIAGDTIVLEPVLKEYRVSAGGNTHPLIQYAAQQGFTFPLNYYETCKGSCPGKMGADLDLASGSARVSADALTTSQDNNLICVIVSVASGGILTCRSRSAPAPAGTCTTKADYLLFEGRELNRFWRIKSIDVSGATVRPHGANRFLVKFSRENKDATCLPPLQITIGDIVVEGPVEDDFVDAANPWKNAFVRPLSITRPIIQPGSPRPSN